jgi:hypothetical protein
VPNELKTIACESVTPTAGTDPRSSAVAIVEPESVGAAAARARHMPIRKDGDAELR